MSVNGDAAALPAAVLGTTPWSTPTAGKLDQQGSGPPVEVCGADCLRAIDRRDALVRQGRSGEWPLPPLDVNNGLQRLAAAGALGPGEGFGIEGVAEGEQELAPVVGRVAE